ncbi:MAG: dynamin family protein [Arcanobacterium sp.]|nr:dynamin family protein [Arcanobacterium sp.]
MRGKDTAVQQRSVIRALEQLQAALAQVHFPFELPTGESGAAAVQRVSQQLANYVIPRFAALDAPLLAVVGGSTGAGKSTLVNSLVGHVVAKASAIRPTTRRPTLVYAPSDEQWFDSTRVLPHVARVKFHGAPAHTAHEQEAETPHTLVPAAAGGATEQSAPITDVALAPCAALPGGLALLDSPDIDSVVRENREFAAELLDAADLWIFVTTAARYADAVPWSMLREAVQRNVVSAVVLNRVPPQAQAEVSADLRAKLTERGLGDAPLFTIPEMPLDAEGFIPATVLAPLHAWLAELGADTAARTAVAQTTLSGTVRSLVNDQEAVLVPYTEQVEVATRLGAIRRERFERAVDAIEQQVGNGTLLTGELLARWQDVLGTGEWSRKLERGVSRLRDRIVGFVSGRPAESVQQAQVAIAQSVRTLVAQELSAAALDVLSTWEHTAGTSAVVAAAERQLRNDAERERAVAMLVQQWEEELLEMVRTQGPSKKALARTLSFGVNALGVALMIVVFANTGGLVGGEIAVAGGTAVVAQKVLEAVFGDSAILRMAARAKADLIHRVRREGQREQLPFVEAENGAAVSAEVVLELEHAYRDLAHAVKAGADGSRY